MYQFQTAFLVRSAGLGSSKSLCWSRRASSVLEGENVNIFYVTRATYDTL